MLTLLFTLASCGGDDQESIGSLSEGEDEADVADVAEEEEEEVDLDDPEGADDELIDSIEAYARTQIQGDPDELVQARSEGCAVVDTDLDAGNAGEGAADEEPSISDVDAEIDGDRATVSYRLDPSGEQIADERWVREDGEWKWDNC